MSRGFVKEGDSEEIPMVPPRAFLPEGVVNYVTTDGFIALEKEKDLLIEERESIATNASLITEGDKRVERNFINAKLKLLESRIQSAKVIGRDAKSDPNIVTFGDAIKIKLNGKIQTLQITGVDEADISKGKISFTSPMAKALIGRRLGEKATIKLPAGEREIEIITFIKNKVHHEQLK